MRVSDCDFLIKYWDFDKNSKASLFPDKISVNSSKKAWWICENSYSNHSYPATISDKFRYKTKCPYCSNKKILTGFNDLATVNKILLKDWDYEKNSLDPTKIGAGSHEKAFWKCHICGYEWEASICSRNGGNGCKNCAKITRVITARNNKIKKNKSVAQLYPHLIDEVYENCIDLSEYTPGSKVPVTWKCAKCGHIWSAPIYSRTTGGQGCLICGIKKSREKRMEKASKRDNLALLRPDLIKEWDYLLNEKGPEKYSINSHEIVNWICKKCGRKWKASIKNRAVANQECVCHLHEKISKKVKKAYLNKNGSLGETFPQLLESWDYEKNERDPFLVSPYSNSEAYWKCEVCGAKWQSSIANRTRNPIVCPKCSRESKTSFPEQAIFFYLKKCTIAFNRYILNGKEIDVYLPLIKFGIEFDGYRFHKGSKILKDREKDAFFKKQGIEILRIKEVKNKTSRKFEVRSSSINSLEKTIKDILSLFNFDIDVNLKRDSGEIYSQYVFKIKSNSLFYKTPKIAKLWCYEKNGTVKPSSVAAFSKKSFYFNCPHCGQPFYSSVQDMQRNSKHCPYCKKKIY